MSVMDPICINNQLIIGSKKVHKNGFNSTCNSYRNDGFLPDLRSSHP